MGNTSWHVLTRRRALAGLTGLAGAAAAACSPGSGGTDAQAGRLPDQTVTLQAGFEPVTSNALTEFEQTKGKELFEQKFPTIKLDFLQVRYQDLEKMTSLMAAGTFPDVIVTAHNLLPVVADKGFVAPLDPFVGRQRGYRDDFPPNLLNTCSYQDKLYSLWRGGGPQVVYYSQRLFSAAGVPAPRDDWDWEAWRQAATRLTSTGDGTNSVWGTSLPPWSSMVWSNGGEILSKDLKTCILDQPAAVEGLQAMQDMIHRHRVAPPPNTPDLPAISVAFEQGRVAMGIGGRATGTGRKGYLDGLKDGTVGLAPLPRGKAGRLQGSNGNSYSMGKTTKWPEAAWRMVDFYAGAEFQKFQFSQGIGGVPGRKSVLTSPEYLNSVLPPKWNEYFARGQSDLQPWPKTAKWGEVEKAITDELAVLERGEANARQVTATLVPKVNAILRG